MKRLFLLLLLLFAGTMLSFAQEADSVVIEQPTKPAKVRKPVTSKWTLLTGSADYTNHYLNSQQYSGEIWGIEAMHGRFYRRSERVSWKLTLSHLRSMNRPMFGGGLENSTNTSRISTQSYEADYAVFYNWFIKDRLQIRVGGSFNLYGGFLYGDNHAINNVLSLDIQAQFFAAAQIRYGWDFKKWGLDIYGHVNTPFMGLMTVDNRYESFPESMLQSEFNLKEHSHLKLSSFHNLQGVNFEMGVDFALRSLTLSLSFESRNRWWHSYELQNYRKIALLKLGISVNLFSEQNRKTNKRQF